MDRFIIPACVLALVLVTWAFLGGQPERVNQSKTVAPPVQSVAPSVPPSRSMRAEKPVPNLPPDASIEIDQDWVAKNGLLGVERRWVDSAMKAPWWQPVAQDNRPTFRNQNGVELSFQLSAGRVQSIRARFPEGAMSADLTALTEQFMGNQSHIPVHMEVYKRPSDRPRFGDFKDPKGRTLYYRAVYRQTGESPFGPEDFRISTTPFDGQTVQLDEHADEHENPVQPIPLDAGALR